MADSKIQLQIEEWIRENWLPQEFHHSFEARRMQLTPGGYFEFDAVSDDNSIVANISTSSSRTARGNYASAKIQKLRADMLFLTMVTADKRLIVLSELDMYEECMKEKNSGRVPVKIEFLHAPIADELKKHLIAAKKIAAQEVTPKNKPDNLLHMGLSHSKCK